MRTFLQGRVAALCLGGILAAAGSTKAQYLVRSYDEAERETNLSKPRLSVENIGATSLSDFQLRYRFLVDPGKTPAVENWYVPGGTASLQSLGGGLWDLVLAFPGQTLLPGQIFPNSSGIVVGLHHTDWSAWDKSDDPSHQTSTAMQLNGKVEILDAAGNVLAGAFPTSGLAGAPRIVVAAREEAQGEANVSRIRLLARNVGDGPTDSLKLQYHFASEGVKVPQLDVYDAAGAVVSLHRVSGRNWRVDIDYSGKRIKAGKRTSEAGVLFALHYPDWSRWDKSNDHSNPGSSRFVVSRSIVGETENDKVAGDAPTPASLARNSDVVGIPAPNSMVAAADGASYLLKPDGTVWGWGYVNQFSRFGTASRHGARFGGVTQEYPVQISELEDIREIAASGDHLLALGGNGIVWAIGSTQRAQVLAASGEEDRMATGTCDRACEIGGLTGIKAIATGGWSRNMALDKDGGVFQWGMPTNRNEDWVGPPVQKAVPASVEIRACESVSLARTAAGAVYAWSYIPEVPVQVVASGAVGLACDDPSNGGLLLKADGSLLRIAGPYAASPYTTSSVTGIPALANLVNQGSGWIGKALAGGSIVVWNTNDWNGQIPTSPTVQTGFSGAVSVAASNSHAIAVLADGTVWAMGRGGYGALGDGTLADASIPVKAAITTGSDVLNMVVESGNKAQELVFENNSDAARNATFRFTGAKGGKVRVVVTTLPSAAPPADAQAASALVRSNDEHVAPSAPVVDDLAPLAEAVSVTTGTFKEGDSKVWRMFNKKFPDYSIEKPNESITAICRKVVQKGDHYFYFWVPADQWGSANGQLDASKIGMLAAKLATDDVSVYQSVRSLVGPEWGKHGYGNLVSETTTDFHVVLDDLDDDGDPDQVGALFTLGYFWPGDVYLQKSVATSNQALVINLDSRWLGYTEAGAAWSPTSSNASQVYSTMAHEMQHMAYFYNKSILGSLEDGETWPNEMLSVLAEEVLADELGWTSISPATTRFVDWMTDPWIPFVQWNDYAYASAYSYGTMLFRNLRSKCEMPAGSNACDMGTANGFHAMLASTSDGFQAVEDAFIPRGQRGTTEWLRLNGVTLAASGSTTPDGAGYPAWSVAGRSMDPIHPWSDTRFTGRPTIYTSFPAQLYPGTSIPVETALPANGELTLTVPGNTWITVLPNF